MKTCICLYSYHKLLQNGYTHFEAVDQTKAFGMDAVELCIFPEFIPERKTMAEHAKAVNDYARSIGLDVPIFTVVDAKLYCDDPEKELERLCSMVDIAADCDIHMMRVDAAWRYKGNETSKTYKKVLEFVAPYIRRLAEYGKKKGVKLCSENHGYIFQDSYRIEELICAVDHENYGLLCDIGNFGSADEDCSVAVSKLLPHICFVHVKDCYVRSGMSYNPGRGFTLSRGGNFRRSAILGHGDIPVFQILSAIKNSGYDGYLSIEYSGIEDNLLALEISAENLLRMVKDLEK